MRINQGRVKQQNIQLPKDQRANSSRIEGPENSPLQKTVELLTKHWMDSLKHLHANRRSGSALIQQGPMQRSHKKP